MSIITPPLDPSKLKSGTWSEWWLNSGSTGSGSYYYDAEFEYFCIRNSCGTYDITPMQKYIVTAQQRSLCFLGIQASAE